MITPTSPEITIGSATYRIGKMDTFTQFHLARKLAPILLGLGQAALGNIVSTTEAKPTQEEWALKALEPILATLGRMDKTDVDYILNTCLSVVYRLQDGPRWAPVQQQGALMFQDISLPTLMRLVTETVKENLSGFFGEVTGGLL